YSGVNLPEGYVARISVSGEWKPNPYWKYKIGAGGDANSKIDAGKFYVKPGVKEGCLLVKSGDTILPFVKDDTVIEIKSPGKIYFCCNDEMTVAGEAKYKEIAAGPRGKELADA